MSRWLIRTTNNVILGPVSRDKLASLVERGVLEANDEVCSGNGYWIYVKEEELIKRYLFDGLKQGLNPIYHSEDDTVEEEASDITQVIQLESNGSIKIEEEEVQVHEEQSDEPIELVEKVSDVKAKTETNDQDDVIDDEVEGESLEAEQKRKRPKVVPNRSTDAVSGSLLKVVSVILILLAFTLIYFREVILNQIFGS